MDYWTECISQALEDAKLTATQEQINTVVSWVEGAHENYSLAAGHDCIPNPMLSEVEALQMHIKKLELAHEKQIWGIRKGVAGRRGVEASDVSITGNGDVTYNF